MNVERALLAILDNNDGESHDSMDESSGDESDGETGDGAQHSSGLEDEHEDQENGEPDDESDIEVDNGVPDDYLGHDVEIGNIVVVAPANPDWSHFVQDSRVEEFTEYAGVAHSLPDDASTLDYFYLFFDADFFQLLVDQTNLYAYQVRNRAEFDGTPNRVAWTATTVPEMRTFIAFQIYFGLKSVGQINDIWSTNPVQSDPFLAKLFSRNRYWSISRYFHLRDTSDVPERTDPAYDPLFKVCVRRIR